MLRRQPYYSLVVCKYPCQILVSAALKLILKPFIRVCYTVCTVNEFKVIGCDQEVISNDRISLREKTAWLNIL